MCDPLRKNLLFPTWFTRYFEGESSASLLGTFGVWENLLLPYWVLRGRILCFFIRGLLWCTWVHWGGIFYLLHRYNA